MIDSATAWRYFHQEGRDPRFGNRPWCRPEASLREAEMRLMLKLILGAVLLIVLLVGLLGTAHWKFERAQQQRFAINDPPLPVVTDEAALAWGAHLFGSRGCSECHGEQGEGQVFLDVPPMRLIAANLTPGGRGKHYDADAFGRAIRHSVAFDGRPLIHMPSRDYAEFSDADTAALAAHIAALPPSSNDLGPSQVHALGRVLYLLGQLPILEAELIDHQPRTRMAPEPDDGVAYGAYVARTCVGCHGPEFRGGKVLGTPPDFPPASDLTAMPGWREADFVRLMREGKRPDDSDVHPLMPWGAFSRMSDDELAALFRYFRSLQ
jgi:cytochrome c553